MEWSLVVYRKKYVGNCSKEMSAIGTSDMARLVSI